MCWHMAGTAKLSKVRSLRLLQKKLLVRNRPRNPPILKSDRGAGAPYYDSSLELHRVQVSAEILHLVAQMVQSATLLKEAKNW